MEKSKEKDVREASFSTCARWKENESRLVEAYLSAWPALLPDIKETDQYWPVWVTTPVMGSSRIIRGQILKSTIRIRIAQMLKFPKKEQLQ